MSKGSAPYLFEPEYTSDECSDLSDSSSESEPEVLGAEEGTNPAAMRWCRCGHCTFLGKSKECVCCWYGVREKKEVTESCITLTERFHSICLDRDILAISLLMIHDTLQKGPLPNPIANR